MQTKFKDSFEKVDHLLHLLFLPYVESLGLENLTIALQIWGSKRAYVF
jgi:hypothetical protein